MSFPTRLKTAMALRGLHRSQTARRAGISRQTLVNWTKPNARMDLDHFLAVCDVLKVRAYWLRRGQGPITQVTTDPQVAEVAKIMATLNWNQRAKILALARELVAHRLPAV
jgi:transcriptional regulator with XRE-family HTH domain